VIHSLIVAGITTPLQNILKSILDWLHTTMHLPWAWAIVALTILVRMALVPLTVRQIHSMQNMQRHAPEMKALQQKYKGDRQKQNEELMKFYKENNINPAASCLPMVAQFPIFIALYFVLKNFANQAKHLAAVADTCTNHAVCSAHAQSLAAAAVLALKHLGDLSWLGIVPSIAAPTTSHWSGYILLVVYAGSQVASTLLMGTTMDRMQRNLLLVLPLAFIFVVARFPTGLVLYWMTTNLWTVGQGLVTRRLVPRTAVAPVKRSSRTPAKADPAPAAALVEEPKEADAEPDGDAQPAKPQAAPRKVRRKKRSGRR
jgi:YidC/Oxa1 family membrane protein insertase